MPARPSSWKTSPARSELLALYAQADAALAPFSCEGSGECCRFGVTGREPYVTPPELAEIEHAIAVRGGTLPGPPTSPRALPVLREERPCPLLGPGGLCSVYSSRPLGCRTFFCDRVQGPTRLPRVELNAIARQVADLAARVSPRDPHSRPLSRALGRLPRRP